MRRRQGKLLCWKRGSVNQDGGDIFELNGEETRAMQEKGTRGGVEREGEGVRKGGEREV